MTKTIIDFSGSVGVPQNLSTILYTVPNGKIAKIIFNGSRISNYLTGSSLVQTKLSIGSMDFLATSSPKYFSSAYYDSYHKDNVPLPSNMVIFSDEAGSVSQSNKINLIHKLPILTAGQNISVSSYTNHSGSMKYSFSIIEVDL